MRKKSLLLLLLLALCAPWAAQAQEELTVCDGTTTNTYIPFYGSYVDTQGCTCEFIIPASTEGMSDMDGGTISKLTFYISGSPGSWGSPTIQVYMGEVDGTTLSGINGPSNFTTVYTGTVSNQTNPLVIELSNAYTYGGGNLLIGTYVQTASSTYKSTSFYGVSAPSGSSFYKYSSYGSGSAQSFLPKTTLTYTPGQTSSCPKPTITGVVEGTDYVSLQWTKDGEVTQWQAECSENSDFTNAATLNVNNGLPYGRFDNLTPGTTYYVHVRSYCGGTDYSNWSTRVSFTTECEAVTAFPWSEDFESYTASSSGVKFEDPCWQNIHLEGSGAYFFEVYSGTNGTNSTKQLRLHDMSSGTMTKLRLPKMTLTTNDDYIFSIDVYRVSATSYTGEGIRVYASRDGEIEDATELAFISRNFGTGDGNFIPAESAAGWYTYELPIPFTGTCYIVLRGESKYGSATYMDNFKVKKVLPCVKPADPTFVSSTTTSATLSWTNGADTQNAWQIAYSTNPSFNPDDVTPVDVTANPGTINGLTTATTYYAYVRADCGTLGYSEWSTTYCEFNTACEAITTFPWNENFESYSTGDFSAPCWVNERIQDGTGTSGSLSIFKIATYSYSGNSTNLLQLPDMKAGTLTKLVFPEMTLPGNDYQFVLDVYRNTNNKPTEGIRVYVSTNGELAGATELAFISRDYTVSDGGLIPAETASDWYTYQLPLGISGTCYIILQGESQYGSATYMDNFIVEQIPSCPKPTGLAVTSGSITAHGATITWTENGEANTWIVEFADNANFENNLNETVENEPTYTFHGLDAETTYYVRVKAHCGEGDESQYSNVVNFTTDAACKIPTNLTCTSVTATAATLSWTESGESTAWQICLNNDEEHLTDIDTDDVTINEGVVTYPLEGFTSATAYTAKVRGICNNEPTGWSNVASFTTLQVAVNLPYSNDFESENGWLFVNGTLTNAWAYGTATSNGEGTHALYISNDDGTTNAYSNGSAAMVYATKLFNFEAGTYVFSYDWKANGESTYDYLRVALVPSSVQLAASSNYPTGFGTNSLPTGWIALDGGSKLNLQQEWQSFATNEMEIAAGTYMMVFAWRDDTSGGSNPPAAIDNVSIEIITCTTPANLAVTENSVTNNSVELSWTETGEATAWQICLNGDESNLTNIDTDDVTINEGVVTYQLTGLTPETAYTVKVRANCDANNQSGWSNETSFTTLSNCVAPDGLNTTELTANSATLNWNGVQDNYNVRYREVITPDVNFNETYDFEDGTLQGWTSYDEDGDNTGWANSTLNPYGGTHCARAVYNSNAVPKNWLISPEIPLGGTLSFYAKRYSSGTGEQFQVFVSTTGTDISNFTPITEVIDATSTYELYEYSLSNFSGNGYVAIKHTAEADQYWFYVDDITITKTTPGEYGEWNTSNTNVTSGLTINGLTPLTMYEWQVQGINDGCTNSESETGVTDWSASATFTTPITKDIIGYGTGTGGYYLIASPVMDDITPSAENGFLTNDYDLYYFDESEDNEWRNYKANAFDIVSGKGYLYASKTDTQLKFTGVPYNGNGEVTLNKKGTGSLEGWNLVGNPFNEFAYINRPFYTLDGNGELITDEITSPSIEAMEAVFVIAETDGETLTFTTTETANDDKGLALNLSRNNSVIDRAVVRFGEGRTLPKFQLNPNHTKVYIPMDGTDYAVVRSEEVGEMPVSFKAENNGSYTLSFSTENVEFGYLHLIDNMTGANVDLLVNPSYSFEAKTTDYASRFKLVFATGNTDDNFAFYSNGSFVVSNDGNATLQVVDVNGRILKSESINGCTNLNMNVATGVYMLRLINGENVKVQKVVVR